jgi:hypothetical protein
MKKPFASESSSLASSISTPPNGLAVMPKRVIRGVRSSPQLSAHRGRPTMNLPETVQEVDTPPECEPERSFGELDAYPLTKASAICKATGGGRWCPKQSPPRSCYRIPGCKAPFEIEMDREEEEVRLRQLNPIIRDGGKGTFALMQSSIANQCLQHSNIDLSSNPSVEPSSACTPTICRLSDRKLPLIMHKPISLLVYILF